MNERARPRVAVVVLNFNGLEDTLACIDSLLACDTPDLHVVVVDNASRNDDAAVLQARFPGVVVLAQTSNLGYTGGNNVGMRHALAQGDEFVFVLNNDTTVRVDTISTLLEYMEANPDVGVAGAVTLHADLPDTVFAAGGRTDYKGRSWNYLPGANYREIEDVAPFDVEYLQGSALFLRSSTLRTVGLFDERFFLNYDETDLCARIRDAGNRVVIVPHAVHWHKIGATIGRFSATQHYYMHRNRLLYLAKRRRWFSLVVAYGLGCVHVLREQDKVLRAAGWAAIKDFTTRRFGQRRAIQNEPPSPPLANTGG